MGYFLALWLAPCSPVRMTGIRALITCLFVASAAAQVCDPSHFAGPYALQLTGTTTISGDEKAAANLSRLVFAEEGKVSGLSFTMFSGYLLSNPVTGSYELGTDCSLTWKLQDDSGAWQHFAGTLTPDLASGQFRQTDPGAPQQGVILKSAGKCGTENLHPRYTYTIAGAIISLQRGQERQVVSGKGTVDRESNDTFEVDDDCTVQFDLVVQNAAGEKQELRMRGILANAGREILAIESDLGAMVAARLTAQ